MESKRSYFGVLSELRHPSLQLLSILEKRNCISMVIKKYLFVFHEGFKNGYELCIGSELYFSLLFKLAHESADYFLENCAYHVSINRTERTLAMNANTNLQRELNARQPQI